MKYVEVTSKSYGAQLKGTRIYYEGKRPRRLRDDGSIQFGKNILELLRATFGPKFRWILSPAVDSITRERGIVQVRTSLRLLDRMYQDQFARNRDLKNDIIRRFFAVAYPQQFQSPKAPVYVPGTLARILAQQMASKLSAEDREAVKEFLPDFIASESIKSVNLLKAAAQIRSLKELAQELKAAIGQAHAESWWQTFIRDKILIIQQGYIKAIEKMNISIGNTKFPDFSLVTHDNYLDILEIKKPDTNLLRLDASRGNYHADLELSRAIIQVENYISNVSTYADHVRTYIFDNYQLNMKVVRPRGIILAGNTQAFTIQKQRDDFRLLSQGLKNITLVPYDELLTRLENYIQVLEEASRMKKP